MYMRWVYLLHGLGGSRNGTVRKLEEALLPLLSASCSIARPQLPHSDPERPGEDCVVYLDHLSIPFGSVLVGISLGGLVASKLQEDGRPDLHVIAISSPTWGAGLFLQRKAELRIALYSSRDEVIAGRTENWPMLATAFELPWLTHDTDQHLPKLASVVAGYVNGENWQARLAELRRRTD